MKYENRNGICMIALATTLCLFSMAQPAFAVEMNPMNWGQSPSEKANVRAKKAEQDAWEAQQRLEKAEKEAQLQLERVKQEAASRKEAAESARKEATLRDEMNKKQKVAAQKQAKLEARRQQIQQEESDRDAAREARQTRQTKQAEVAQAKQQKQNQKSIWNPLSWFGGSDTQQAKAPSSQTPQSQTPPENQPSGKAAATALLMQSSEGQEISEGEPVQQTEQRLVAKGKKEATVVLPEGIKQEDARYYEEARKMRAALIETQRGNIIIELYPDVAPVTVTNFVKLTGSGFYNQLGMKFHRVVPGFVVQTGDPTGTGAGGSKERIPLEAKNRLSHDAKGVVAMARGASPDSATSQFYITLAPQKMLDAKYAIFGRVIQGFDVLEKIEKDDRLYGVKMVDERTITREDPNAASKQSLLKKLF